jgi:hypothetical protein
MVWLNESGLNRSVQPPQPADTCFLALCYETEIQRARQESVEIDGSGDSMCGCSIKCLQSSFTSLSCDEKVGIIEMGRPMPDFQIHTNSKRNFVRHFRSQCYENVAWLCGCSKIKCLFPAMSFILQR